MGVPRLFPWLVKNFPKAVSHFQQGESQFKVDHLYLDANGILHKYAQLVYHYGEGKRKMNMYADLSDATKRKKLFSMFMEAIVDFTEIIIPQKTLYIAIDGPAPRAKKNQQRERRFAAAKTRTEESSGKPQFDSNSMTPGTMFMHELTKYINYSIRKTMNSRPRWRGLEIIFSPPTIPGEGEHKIMDYIREQKPNVKEIESHCIFSPDGDLVMLTLASHIPNMFLFREDQFNYGYYHYVDMGMIRRDLPKVTDQEEGYVLKKRGLNDVTNDFIVEGFFVGNDFLPKIQMFHLLEDGLELMLKTYSQTSKNGKENPLTKRNEIDLNGFKLFVEKLSEKEVEFLIDQATTRNPRKTPPEPKFRNETLLKCISQDEKGEFSLDMEMYREGYYAKVFEEHGTDNTQSPLKINTPKFNVSVKKMCRDYLRSFIWVCEYYIKGLPAWNWAYQYHYAPLMYDFNKYIQSLELNEFEELSKFDLGRPSRPFEQLLEVLPPASAELLPVAYRRLMLHPQSPLVKAGYYPDDFHVDYEGKLKDFQGIVILPFVDDRVIHENYEKMTNAMNKVKPKKYFRNSPGSVSMFTYDPKYTADYTSEVGNLKNSHVRKTTI